MITKLKTSLSLAAVAVVCSTPLALNASINFTGGPADLTFFYESGPDSWVTTLRAKSSEGNGVTGLTNPFNNTSTPSTWTGIVGNQVAGTAGNPGDYLFDELIVGINTNTSLTVGTTDYLLTAATGSPLLASGTPDLGILTRLREGDPAANQFAGFNLILNLGASTFNGNPLADNANVSLLAWDGLDNPVSLIDTAAAQFVANFDDTTNNGVYTHVHRNWGFSDEGTYELVFGLQGIGGTHGGDASIGSTAITFVVVPEPGTFAALAGVFALGMVLIRRRVRR